MVGKATADTYLYKGERLTVRQIAKATGLHTTSIYSRVRALGLRPGDAFPELAKYVRKRAFGVPKPWAGNPDLYIFEGWKVPLSKVAKTLGVTPAAIHKKLAALGVKPGDEIPALTFRKPQQYEFDGELRTVREIAERLGVSVTKVRNMIKAGEIL